MKTMVVYGLRTGASFSEAARRFVSGEAGPPEGLTLLGRWHSVDMSTGFALYDSEDAAPHYAAAAKWVDVLEFKTYLVIEDNEAGPILASIAKK